MAGLIYQIFNTTNGKSYVGQTKGSLYSRWHSHKQTAKSGRGYLLHKAIHSHGEENFVITKLLECSSEELNDAEIYWGMHFDCLAPKGYSLKLGNSKQVVSEETRNRMSVAQTGKKRSREAIEKTAKSLIGRPGGMQGKKHSSEAIEKIRIASVGRGLGRKLSDETKAKLSSHFSGKKLSDETKHRMTLSRLGKKRGPYKRKDIQDGC